MPADLRTAMLQLTTFELCAWTLQELSVIAESDPIRAKAYATQLVRRGVLHETPEGYRTTILTARWRKDAQAAARDAKKRGGSYGNSASYRARKAIMDVISTREWQAKRQGATWPVEPVKSGTLTDQEGAGAIMTEQEVARLVASDFLAPEAVAIKLGVSLATVRREISRGNLRAISVGRLRRVATGELSRYLFVRLSAVAK